MNNISEHTAGEDELIENILVLVYRVLPSTRWHLGLFEMNITVTSVLRCTKQNTFPREAFEKITSGKKKKKMKKKKNESEKYNRGIKLQY